MTQLEIDKITNDVGLQKCSYNDQCDFCDSPKLGTFIRTGGHEYNDDWYWICGNCFVGITRNFPRLTGMKLGIKIDKIKDTLPVKLPF